MNTKTVKIATKFGPSFLLVIAFTMLWLPVGQHEFLIAHWMKLGTFMAPFLLFTVCAFWPQQGSDSNNYIRLVSLLLFVAYLVHQFEEHWIDLNGNEYAFKNYLNDMLRDSLNVSDNTTVLLSDTGIFVINTSLVWLVASLSILQGSAHVFSALCMNAIVLVNAISHLAASVFGQEYNPGLATAVTVFFPLSIIVYHWVLRTETESFLAVCASMVWGILAHIVMIAGIILTGFYQLIPDIVFFTALVGWSLLPLLFFRRAMYSV